ncbi:MAG: mandelate racemase/muconate lactonizing enzyme family protein [Thaumarchaeota archaeon]|nr:mandelate racemase/muconate lactonizing enzyme family protein [Nitrososphaerota archaeon]
MKISNIEIFQLGDRSTASDMPWAGNEIVLKLTTSNGEIGWGESVPTLRVKSVVESLYEVARVYSGKDPFNVEANSHEWYKHDFYLASAFESTTALSAFDIACWDIIGKSHGAPIRDLLGGTTRDKIRLYSNGWYEGCLTPSQFGERAKEISKLYSALKFDPFANYYDWIDEDGLQAAYDRVKSVKDSTEGKVELMIEHHGRFNPNSAIWIAKKMRELDPLFMEEPIHPDNVEGLRKYRRSTDVRIALGERLINSRQVLSLLSENLVDFLQPDLLNIGGITGARKVAAIAEAYGVEIAFHNAFGPIQNAATLQLDAVIPNFLIQESFYDFMPLWKKNLVKNQPKIEDGHSALPTKPGLGIDIDEKLLEDHRTSAEGYFNPEEPVWVVKSTWRSA